MNKTSTARYCMSRRSVCAALALLPFSGYAQLRVEITGVGAQQFPIATAPFAQDSQPAQEIDKIVRADLERSGLFRIVDAGTQPIPDNANVNLAEWKGRGADALAIGSGRRLADGRYDVRFRLLDTVKQGQIDGLSYVASANEIRLTAHRIADRIYEKPTGERAGLVRTEYSLRRQAGPHLRGFAHGRPRRRDPAGGAAIARADHFARVVAG